MESSTAVPEDTTTVSPGETSKQVHFVHVSSDEHFGDSDCFDNNVITRDHFVFSCQDSHSDEWSNALQKCSRAGNTGLYFNGCKFSHLLCTREWHMRTWYNGPV